MIEKKLKDFIKKYYLNTLITGILITISSILLTTIIFSVLEYYGKFNTITRFIFFILYISINGSVIINYIIKPILQISNIGFKKIDLLTAATLIRNKNIGINDELINYIQLKSSKQNNDLRIAAINQKNIKYKTTNFTEAINKKSKRNFIKIATSCLLIFSILIITKPYILKESTHRIINYKKIFNHKKVDIYISKKQLITPSRKKHKIDIYVNGVEIPKILEIEINGYKYILNKINKKHFNYTFRNLNKDIKFKILNSNFILKVYKKANIKSFKYIISPPKHTRKKEYIIDNQPNINIEEGSEYELNIIKDKLINLKINKQKVKNSISGQLFKDSLFRIETYNKYDTLTLKHSIKIKKDKYPIIEVKHSKKEDDIIDTISIKDDYGFKKLKLILINFNDTTIKNIGIDPVSINQKIINKISINNNNIEYYYIIYDNDVINNFKNNISDKYTYKKQNISQIIEKSKEDDKKKENEINKSLKEIEKINNEINREKTNNINNNKTSNQKEELTEKLKKQLAIQKQINELEKELSLPKEDTLDKKINNLLKQIDQLKQELTPEQIKEIEEDIIKENQIQEEKLKRTLELLKNKKAIEELKKIKEELIKEIKNINKINIDDTTKLNQLKTNLKISEEEINKNLNQLNKKENKIKSLKEANNELDKKNKEIAKDKIKETIDKLDEEIKKEEQKKEELNLKNLKVVLFNTINLSINQEDCISKNPKLEKQIELNKNTTNTLDSIIEISKNSASLSNIVIDLIYNIKKEQNETIGYFEENNVNQINRTQQNITTNLNKLAVILNNAANQTKNKLKGEAKNSNKNKIEKQLKDQLKQLKDQKGKKLSNGKKITFMKNGEKINNEINKIKNKETQEKLRQLQDNIKKDILHDDINNKTINNSVKQIVKFLEYNKTKETQNKNNKRESEKNEIFKDIKINSTIENKDRLEKNKTIIESIIIKENYNKQNNIYINNK